MASDNTKPNENTGLEKPVHPNSEVAHINHHLVFGGVAGIIGMFTYICVAFSFDFRQFGSIAGIVILIAMAAFASGYLMGFLFGIPKMKIDPANNNKYDINSNLNEISDWLTKIIVGLGLVQLTKIPGYMSKIATFVGTHVPEAQGIQIYTCCAIIYFAVFGFYMGYNYTRIVLSGWYRESDDDLNEIKTENVQLKDENKNLTKVKDNLIKTFNETSLNKNEDEIKSDLENPGPAAAITDKPEDPNEQFTKPDTPDADRLTENEYAPSAAIPDTPGKSAQRKWVPKLTFYNMIAQAEKRLKIGKEENPEDPNKNQWGKDKERNGLKLSGTVQAIDGAESLYTVTIKAFRIDPARVWPEGELVVFALHPTFEKPITYASVKNGEALLVVVAYGSFTVGALTDEGNTVLELDLAELPGVSEKFKNT